MMFIFILALVSAECEVDGDVTPSTIRKTMRSTPGKHRIFPVETEVGDADAYRHSITIQIHERIAMNTTIDTAALPVTYGRRRVRRLLLIGAALVGTLLPI